MTRLTKNTNNHRDRQPAIDKVSNKTFRDFMKTAHSGSENLQYGINYYVNQENKDKFKYENHLNYSDKQSKLIQQRNKQFNQLMQADDSFEKICLKITAKSTFISGLGSNHITETGINLHPTYGVPFIPGSMLKGVVNNWLIRSSELNKQLIPLLALTGLEGEDENEESQGSKGLLVFHDCFFSQLELKNDIMTPHYGTYYESGIFVEEDQTNPVKFKTVDFKNETELWVTWDKTTVVDDKIKLAKIIIKAIEETGLGAKTNVGYGVFQLKLNEQLSGIS